MSKLKFLENERTLSLLDKIVTNEAALAIGIMMFVMVQMTGWWGWLDPLLNLVVIPFAVATAYEYWRAKPRRYSVATNGESVIVALSVNQDVSASVQRHFGRVADIIISAEQEVGTKFLSPDQVHDLAKKLAARCLPHRDKVIYLVLAGPAGLCFQVGQLLAAHKFRIVPLSWASDRYQEIPIMGIEDIGF